MRSEPSITVTCDRCESWSEEAGLTALAQRSYDERNVNSQLRRAGWRVDGGEEICPSCQEAEGAEPDELRRALEQLA